jgi:hypothetical protein
MEIFIGIVILLIVIATISDIVERGAKDKILRISENKETLIELRKWLTDLRGNPFARSELDSWLERLNSLIWQYNKQDKKNGLEDQKKAIEQQLMDL